MLILGYLGGLLNVVMTVLVIPACINIRGKNSTSDAQTAGQAAGLLRLPAPSLCGPREKRPIFSLRIIFLAYSSLCKSIYFFLGCYS